MVGEKLEFISREFVVVKQYVVMRGPAGALNSGVREEVEIRFCRMGDPVVHDCKQHHSHIQISNSFHVLPNSKEEQLSKAQCISQL